MELHTIDIDLGKTVFHLVGLNLRGEVVMRKKFSRLQLLRFTANRQIRLRQGGGPYIPGLSIREIAKGLQRAVSTVSREVRVTAGVHCIEPMKRAICSEAQEQSYRNTGGTTFAFYLLGQSAQQRHSDGRHRAEPARSEAPRVRAALVDVGSRTGEMAKHKSFTVATNVKVYFCDLQSP